MKTSTIILLLLVPIVIFAQNYQGMNPEAMQQMQKMQECMQKVDQTKLKAIEQRSRQMEAKIKSLCASGKRKEAQAEAISFGKAIAKDPTLKAMGKCSAMMKEVMPKMPYMGQDTGRDKDRSKRHVCD